MDSKKANENSTPGPSRMNPTSNSASLERIKTEPGQSDASARLTTFRRPRNLTLIENMKPEKPKPNKTVYRPNTSHQRTKSKDDAVPVKVETKTARGRGRGRGRGQERGRGRGKTATTIQSTGIFSEGIGDGPRAIRGSRGGGYGRGSGDRDAKPTLDMPKLNLNHVIDKADEEETLKALLRDDFIDDGTDGNYENCPVALPLIKEAKEAKTESKTGKKVVEEEEIDVKPVILENGQAVAPPMIKPLKKSTEKNEIVETCVPEIMENATESYLMLRLPDCLPGFRSEEEIAKGNTAEKQSKNEYCTLNSLQPGLLGKIQIHQSGKARLVLGNNTLVIDVGSQLGFRQDVIATKLADENSELINLGPISNTLVCTPDFESILGTL